MNNAIASHYDILIDENNDPVHDPEPLKEYMDKWDGLAFINKMELNADKSVLEIGVGTGRLAVRVAPLCKKFCGIDISPKTIDRAKENLSSFENVELICGDFLEYSFGIQFNVIYSCEAFASRFDGDIRRLFDENNNDIEQIKRYVQLENKKAFPYLSGVKICNYWLYVIHQYTDRKFNNLDALTVAPDTHVCKASLQLGLITEGEYNSPNVQQIVIEAWKELFKGTQYKPIDIHTPLWLWSRNGFKEVR